MSVDFGIRLTRFPRDNAETLDFIDRTLKSLSEHVATIWAMDHLQFGDTPFFESWVMLSYLAAAYPRFKVSHLVNAQSFRNPALLAKMGASLQNLSQGRFIMSLGAGWHKDEYDAYNFEFPSPRLRIEQLEDTIQILRAMWTTQPATYHGRHYHIENAYCAPQPTPVPTIMVGSGGNKGIGVAARLADGWNWDYRLDTFAPRYERLKQECEKAGRNVSDLWLTGIGDAHFPKDAADFVPHNASNLSAEPKLGPTPADAIEQLRPFIEDYGVSHFQIFFEDQRTIDVFCNEVAPKLVALA
jgi:alkanesulfonate monooxygenase SsuD/methylene tetrahydromethanopterin reductase-like flavin-dependent oxidoreductase (luciferase family)